MVLDLASSGARFRAYYPLHEDYGFLFMDVILDGSYNGYNIRYGTGVSITVYEDQIYRRYVSTSCSATAFSPDTSCGCLCTVCNNGNGIRDNANGIQVNCDACVLIPANSSGALLPPTDINYPKSTECIKLKV
jgi:hypothetical protein